MSSVREIHHTFSGYTDLFLFVDDPSLQLQLFRGIYPVVFLLSATVAMVAIGAKLFGVWMRKVREDAYMIGKQLHNFEETGTMSTSTK